MAGHMPHFLTLARIDDEIAVIAIIAGAVIVLVWIIAATLDSILKSKHKEETRREIAAYVAEGSISPNDATAILNAGDEEVRKSIADGVAWGTIKPKDAERLINAQRPAART